MYSNGPNKRRLSCIDCTRAVFKLFVYIITLYTLRNRPKSVWIRHCHVHTLSICKITRRNNSSFILKHSNAYVWAAHVYVQIRPPYGRFTEINVRYRNTLVFLPILTLFTFKWNWFEKKQTFFRRIRSNTHKRICFFSTTNDTVANTVFDTKNKRKLLQQGGAYPQ